jgi:hypothetical protein
MKCDSGHQDGSRPGQALMTAKLHAEDLMLKLFYLLRHASGHLAGLDALVGEPGGAPMA